MPACCHSDASRNQRELIMAFAAVPSATVIGVDGHVVRVEANVSPGVYGFHVTGVPETSVASIRDRVRAAVINSGLCWPDGRITVNVLPPGMPKYGTPLDLAVAVAVLAADEHLNVGRMAFIGELGLDGALRPVRGLPCAVRALVDGGVTTVALPVDNLSEAGGCRVLAAASLAELVSMLSRDELIMTEPSASPVQAAKPLDLSDVVGNQPARRALEVCAAGGHHLFVVGDGPAAMLAERLPGILPALDDGSSREVTEVYSLTDSPRHDVRPPYCAPHYSAPAAAIFGGGRGFTRPGAVSLAHRGVLFIDDALEFPAMILDGLRRPLGSGEVILAGVGGVVRMPARFQLVMAPGRCRCPQTHCSCRPVARLRSIRDRIEVSTKIESLDWSAEPGEPSTAVAARVAEAHERAAARLADVTALTNAEVSALDLRTRFRVAPDALDPLEVGVRCGLLAPTAITRILRVSWTLADLRGADQPTIDDTTAALALWLGE